MKKITIIIGFLIFILLPNSLLGQNNLSNCNSFDNNVNGVYIDTNGIWSIGAPDKNSFDSSYSGQFSIVTDLNEPYKKSDTSSFYIELENDGYRYPNYLGILDYLMIEFEHRFITDSDNDYGEISISLDNGKSWAKIEELFLSQWCSNCVDTFTLNYHKNEITGDVVYENLKISGNSNGWVHSKYTLFLDAYIYNNHIDFRDTALIKFSFISDSTGEDEGWQIDDLCIYTYDKTTSIDNTENIDFKIYPNPGNGSFKLEGFFAKNCSVQIFNAYGQKVFTTTLKNSKAEIDICNQANGVYFIWVEVGGEMLARKILKE